MTEKDKPREFTPLPRGPMLPNGRRLMYMPPELLRDGAGGLRAGKRKVDGEKGSPAK